jgi:pimeloyl-ACP methyl ester carboxylesterase
MPVIASVGYARVRLITPNVAGRVRPQSEQANAIAAVLGAGRIASSPPCLRRPTPAHAGVNTWLTDSRGDVPKINVRTLLVHGDADRILPYEVTAKRLRGSAAVNLAARDLNAESPLRETELPSRANRG